MRHYGIIILEMCAKCVPTLSFYMIPYDFKIAVSLDNTEFMILHYSSKLFKNALPGTRTRIMRTEISCAIRLH